MVGKIFIIVLFMVVGTMLSLGKWSFLIAGFNTMSKEEKEKYDVKSLCKFIGKFMFLIAFCIVLCILSDILMMKIFLTIGTTLICISTIFVVVYANTGNRFERKK